MRKAISNQISLLFMDTNKYHTQIINLVKSLKNHNICFVSLNRTSASLFEDLRKKKINCEHIFVIDGITKTFQNPAPQKNVHYLSGPVALTEISLTVRNCLKDRCCEYVIFDSISTLLVYEPTGGGVVKFITSLMNNIKTVKANAIFTALYDDKDKMLIQEAAALADVVENFGKTRLI